MPKEFVSKVIQAVKEVTNVLVYGGLYMNVCRIRSYLLKEVVL